MGNETLYGKVAVISGAASGIGAAIARTFAREGARIVAADLREEPVEALAGELRREGADAIAVAADASLQADWERVMARAEAALGPPDILVNNAGRQHVAQVEDFPVEIFRELLDLMLMGAFLSTRLVVPAMKARRSGRIINIASINGLVGFPGKAAYNAAKHGLIGLTRVVALETAPYGITVNALCPGYVDTPLVRNQLAELSSLRGIPEDRVIAEVIAPLVPQNRLLDPSEVADYAAFLASERAKGVTGQAVVIDGGYTAQ
jgi:3-hydroxybutyrate dehydrogenase